MPDSGQDPSQPGGIVDASGGGLDPGAWMALSQGGHFPGDTQNYLGYLGSTGGQPQQMAQGGGGRAAPGILGVILSLLGVPFGGLLGGAAGNALGKYSTPGQPPTDPAAGGPQSFWSGPGAAYGPPGSTIGGLGDIGNRTPADGTDAPLGNGPGASGPASTPSGHRHGGGGGGGGTYVFHPYGGLQGQGSFVAWNPKYPGEPAGGATFTGGSGSSDRPAPAPAPGPPARGGHGAPGGGGANPPGGGSTGRPGGGQGGRPGGKPPAPQPAAGGAGPQKPPGANAPNAANVDYHGVDTSNVDRGAPGWMPDPTTGIQDTAGLPLPTLPAPKPGESYQDYMTQLHDAGFSSDAIASVMGAHGFQPGAPGGTYQAPAAGGGPLVQPDQPGGWNWGTGPVVSTNPGGGGYAFANQVNSPGLGSDAGPNAADMIRSGGGGGGIRNLLDTILGVAL